MRIWKILSYLWPFSRTSGGRGREPRRTPGIVILGEADVLEDRIERSTIFPAEAMSDRVRPAEVFQVSMGQRQQQASRTQNRFVRLSVVIVDYLLEYEWLSLLGGHARRQAGERRGRRPATRKMRHDPQVDRGDPTEESNRTACVNDSPWSIVAAVEQNPSGDSTTEAD